MLRTLSGKTTKVFAKISPFTNVLLDFCSLHCVTSAPNSKIPFGSSMFASAIIYFASAIIYVCQCDNLFCQWEIYTQLAETIFSANVIH
jgi:hypothetical protein